MSEEVYPPGRTYLDLLAKEYIPALQRGDQAAAQTTLAAMTQAYEQHRQGVIALVQPATR